MKSVELFLALNLATTVGLSGDGIANSHKSKLAEIEEETSFSLIAEAEEWGEL